MNRLLLVLCLTAGACAPAVNTTPDSAPANADVLRYVGDFYAPRDTLFVREIDGRLEGLLKRIPATLTRVRGDTFDLGGRRVVISESAARLGDVVFERRQVAAGTFRITP